ncbi:cytochrome P450 1A1-like [Haliotis rufescens]|uniref:cytochrome P450 1A1-like n=1 Tax=Haliotis rufescens TaxID=6454 RepID=UPI00201FAB07|nr:cytochrome P450 1A1-like [Haliotis rufescens]
MDISTNSGFISTEAQVFVVTFLVSAALIKVVKSLTPSHTPPGPWGVPVLGTLPFFGKEPNVTFTEMWQKYGNVFSIKLGSWPAIVVNGREAIREALVEKGDIFSSRPKFFTTSFSNGTSVSFSEFTDDYKFHRRNALGALSMFANAKKNPIERIVNDEVDFVDNSFKKHNEQPFNPHDYIFIAAGSVIYQICYGVQEDVRENKDFVEFILNVKKFTNFVSTGNPFDALPWLRHFMRDKYRQFKDLLSLSKSQRMKKIKEHEETFQETDIRDVTDRLLQLSNQGHLDKETLQTTLADFFGAGFVTIATTTEWTLLLMAAHPEIQDKVLAEIDEVVGSERKPTLADRGKMTYTEAVIHESMRLTSISPLAIPHLAMEDTWLQGYHIKKGTVAFINLYSMSQDKNVWGDPEVFRPERFLDEFGQIRRSLLEEFLPFSIGRRRCLGEFLARMEVFLLITGTLQKYRLQKPADVDRYSLQASFGLVRMPKPFQIVAIPR